MKAQQLKALREQQLAARAKAARNRRRARLGLPPEEDGELLDARLHSIVILSTPPKNNI